MSQSDVSSPCKRQKTESKVEQKMLYERQTVTTDGNGLGGGGVNKVVLCEQNLWPRGSTCKVHSQPWLDPLNLMGMGVGTHLVKTLKGKSRFLLVCEMQRVVPQEGSLFLSPRECVPVDHPDVHAFGIHGFPDQIWDSMRYKLKNEILESEIDRATFESTFGRQVTIEYTIMNKGLGDESFIVRSVLWEETNKMGVVLHGIPSRVSQYRHGGRQQSRHSCSNDEAEKETPADEEQTADSEEYTEEEEESTTVNDEIKITQTSPSERWSTRVLPTKMEDFNPLSPSPIICSDGDEQSKGRSTKCSPDEDISLVPRHSPEGQLLSAVPQ